MNNYDLTNSHQSVGQSADAGERRPMLTNEQNRRATFSRRSTTVSTPEQAEQQLPSTGDEQIPEQSVLADFDISFSLDIIDPLTVDEPEDPFGALATYRPVTFDDNSKNQALCELGLGSGLLEGFTVEDLTDLAAEDITDVVMAELENDGLESLVQPEQRKQPEQSQRESEKGIVVLESANPDTVSGNRSDKRRAPEPENVVTEDIPESASKESQRRSMRLIKKRQKLDTTETKFLPLPQGTATGRQTAAVLMPENSAASRNYIGQSPDQSLQERVEEETDKLIIVRENVRGRFMCGYPGCGRTYKMACRLKAHIFSHIRISVFKCNYPVCAEACYFRDATALRRHVLSRHSSEKPYLCTICDKRFKRLDTYKGHMRNIHRTAP